LLAGLANISPMSLGSKAGSVALMLSIELAETLGFDAAHRRLRRCSDSQRGFLRKDVAWTFPPGVLSNACHRLPDFWNSYEKLLSCLSRL
jgi:hypothetical protein